MISKHQPIICEVGNSGEQDAYLQAGDPIGVRNLCKLLFGEIELENLQSTKINLIIKPLE